MNLHNLMTLFHLHVIHIKGKELLVDYSQSHVIFNEYLRYHMKKVMDKATIKEIRKVKQKEREDKRAIER